MKQKKPSHIAQVERKIDMYAILQKNIQIAFPESPKEEEVIDLTTYIPTYDRKE